MKNFITNMVLVLLGHKVVVSRKELADAWDKEVAGHTSVSKVPDYTGTIFNSEFNDMCKSIGLKEGK